MELLPIIYWSLVGFGTLALLAISTSYITYQIRKKFEKVESEVNANEKLLKKVVVKSEVAKSASVQHPPKVKRKQLKTDYVGESVSYKDLQKRRITILNEQFKRENPC